MPEATIFKAMILAAGFGTRLLPFTKTTPKVLFPIAGRPLLDIIIQNLQVAGCKSIIINTHHLYHKIDSFLKKQKYTLPVYTRYEPVILGTGGGIKNVADFWDEHPFLVLNSDIITDIDLRKIYDYHLQHNYPATLVLHDYPQFNNVWVRNEDFITGFNNYEEKRYSDSMKRLAFTGIQVLDPEILDLIPDGVFSNIIDIYGTLISNSRKVKAFISKHHYWRDIGTPESYMNVVFEKMAPEAFRQAWPEVILDCRDNKIKRKKLKGDGSSRNWYRLTAKNHSLVMVDHFIRTQSETSEVDSFVAIGRHLYQKKISVPKIYLYDAFSGLVFTEDLGDVDLQTIVHNSKNMDKIVSCYKSVINLLIKLSVFGAEGFNPSWAYQTPYYSKNLVLDKECRYFVDAFLNGYLKMDLSFDNYENEFLVLADKALEFPVNGFMHRDLQSRNIMVKNDKFHFIDFQGGRIGPIQYDLASLLIDPYVELPYPIQAQLLDYCIERLSTFLKIDEDNFRSCYKYCSITRNLQMLGAFGFLNNQKGKPFFKQYIPAAVKTLKHNLSAFENTIFSGLKSVVQKIFDRITG